jgi:hypothetical protein
MKPRLRGSSTRSESALSGRWTNNNHEIRLAVVTVAASFVATFGYLWWQHGPLWPVAAPPARQAGPSISRLPPKPQPVNSPPIRAPAPEPGAPPVASRPAATITVPAANFDGPTLPLLVSFATVVARPGDEENSAEGVGDEATRGQIDIQSTSDQLLAVTVIDVNVAKQKTSSTQVLLSPNARAHISADSGLPIESGDDITLRSSGFRDMSQRAP